MGLFGAIMNGMGKMIGEQLWPVYEDARMKDPRTIQSIINNETNNIRRAVYLLALIERDRESAKRIYMEEQRSYNNAFNNLRNYRKFVEVIDMFMRRCDQLERY